MKNLKLNYWIFCALLFSALSLQAQEVKTLTLADAIEYAMENQADAKKSQLDIENTEYMIREARSGALPQLTGISSLSYNLTPLKVAVPAGMLPGGEEDPNQFAILEMGDNWSASAGLVLMQNLFNQQVFTGLKAAKTTREFYRINSKLTEEQIIERVATAYFEVFVQKDQLETVEATIENMTRMRNVIASLYENGLAKEIDLDRVTVQLSNLNSNRQQLINGVELRENALKFFMGMSIDADIRLMPGDFEINEYLLSDSPEVENRTEMEVLKKQEELLKLKIAAEKAAFYPSLSLMALYNYSGSGSRFPIGADLGQGVYWSEFSFVGLNLQIPIFSGFANRAKVDQAGIELRVLEEEIRNTELGLDLEYRNAKAAIENNLLLLEAQKDNTALAQKVVDNTESNYKLGLADLTEVIQSQNALTEAKNNYTNAVLQYKLAEVQLLKSMGQLYTLK